MKILLLGKDGQIGTELTRSLFRIGELAAFGKSDANFLDHDGLRQVVRRVKPDVIVNAAAYTAVDKAETEKAVAGQINAKAVSVLAQEAKLADAWLVHYSTDYVFDGKKPTPYVETDKALPLNAYGQSKKDGEDAVLESGCDHLIFRSSWVFAGGGDNFPKKILKKAAEERELHVVDDCIGAPTRADLIADVTALVLYRLFFGSDNAQQLGGLYHLTASGKTSRYGYAEYLLACAAKRGWPSKLEAGGLSPIASSAYPSAVARPMNSCLDGSKLREKLGIYMPDWKCGVERFVNELEASRLL